MAVARGEAGARAEALAAAFLMARGLTIVERNFRCRRGEIDLIARDGETRSRHFEGSSPGAEAAPFGGVAPDGLAASRSLRSFSAWSRSSAAFS